MANEEIVPPAETPESSPVMSTVETPESAQDNTSVGSDSPSVAPLMAVEQKPEADQLQSENSQEQLREVDYEKLLTESMPEGFVLDEKGAGAAKEFFAKHKLPPEAAKEAVELYCKMQADGAKKIQETTEQTVSDWTRQLTGREQYKTEMPMVRRGIGAVVKEFPETRKLFDDPVFGNMPELYEVMLFVGKNIASEGQLVGGGAPGENGRSPADIIFGK